MATPGLFGPVMFTPNRFRHSARSSLVHHCRRFDCSPLAGPPCRQHPPLLTQLVCNFFGEIFQSPLHRNPDCLPADGIVRNRALNVRVEDESCCVVSINIWCGPRVAGDAPSFYEAAVIDIDDTMRDNQALREWKALLLARGRSPPTLDPPRTRSTVGVWEGNQAAPMRRPSESSDW